MKTIITYLLTLTAALAAQGDFIFTKSGNPNTPVLLTPVNGRVLYWNGATLGNLDLAGTYQPLGSYATAAQGAKADTALQPGGAAGTPSSITLTNASGLPLTTGVTGVLGFANGGMNATTAAGAITSLNTDGALDVALCMPVYRTLAWISPTQTNTGTGASGISESVNINTGTTANSTALVVANATVNGWGGGALNQSGKAIDWTKRVTIGFSFAVILAPSANAKFGVRLGFQPAGDMNRRGIGIIVDGTSLKIETHNGTTRAVSSSIQTLAVGDCVYVVLQSFGGSVRCWINGVLAGTLTGAPTSLEGLSNLENISTFVANQADATNNRWQVSPAMIRVTF